MQRTTTPMIAASILLAALAGYVDAITYVSLGGFFGSFMSGNTTRLGLGLGVGTTAVAWTAGALLLAFVCGVMIATILAAAFERHRRPAAMIAVAILLAAAVLLLRTVGTSVPLLLLAVAMGAENGIFLRDREPAIGLTYVTGTLVTLGETLAEALLGRGPGLAWVAPLLLWLGFAGGVILGARAHADQGYAALWYAAAGAAVLAGLLAMVSGRSEPSRPRDA
jgi:uncharacterized membrane protein YoaK (UPF0700 family)